jgi:RNA polymerase sigma-70 factor (ECF subfamily)
VPGDGTYTDLATNFGGHAGCYKNETSAGHRDMAMYCWAEEGRAAMHHPGTAPAPELARIARRGDPGAFDDLIGPLVGPAYRLAFSMVRDPSTAEDVVQDAAIRAWRQLGQLRAESALRPWFLRIVANECRRHRKSRWTSVLKMANLPRPARGDWSADGLDLRLALGALSDNDRLPLALFFFLDLPMAEVGAVLGISPGAARARVYRAVRRLRPHLLVEEDRT